MRIQHNITALNAHRQLGINNTSVGKNLEKLSSGFRINRAGDDAAGLAISEKMRGQIRGLDMASNNAQDGISLIQTAEGNLQETHSILQRMRELAVQSSNGTFENTNDRENLDKEVQALKAEVDRIANSAHFNNAKLLNGDLEATVAPAGTLAAASKIDPTSVNGAKGSDAVAAVYEADVAGAATGDTVKVFGATTGTAFSLTADGTAAAIATALNAAGGTASKEFIYSSSGSKVIATAKTAGATLAATDTKMKAVTTGIAAPANTAVKNSIVGNNAGAGDAAKAASYKFDFDITKLAGGQTFTLGNKTFEFSTDGNSKAGNVEIDISALNLTDDTGASTAAGQLGAATKIQDAITTAFGGGAGAFNVDPAPVAASVIAGKYVINMTAKLPGTDGNLGAIREDVDAAGAAGFLTGTQIDVGAAQGTPKPTIFAKATIDMDFSKFAAGDTFKIDGKTFKAVAAGGTADASKNEFLLGVTGQASGDNFAAALESSTFTHGKAVYDDATKKLTITSNDATKTSIDFVADLGAVVFDPETDPAGSSSTGGVVFQIGANGTADDRVSLTIEAQDSATLGIAGIDIKTITGANAAIDLITTATNKVSGTRADLGALQNRLEHTVANLGTTSENLTAAESRIRDVDMAKEMMEMTKNNILSQAAQAMLAQANQQPQGILQLLR